MRQGGRHVENKYVIGLQHRHSYLVVFVCMHYCRLKWIIVIAFYRKKKGKAHRPPREIQGKWLTCNIKAKASTVATIRNTCPHYETMV